MYIRDDAVYLKDIRERIFFIIFRGDKQLSYMRITNKIKYCNLGMTNSVKQHHFITTYKSVESLQHHTKLSSITSAWELYLSSITCPRERLSGRRRTSPTALHCRGRTETRIATPLLLTHSFFPPAGRLWPAVGVASCALTPYATTLRFYDTLLTRAYVELYHTPPKTLTLYSKPDGVSKEWRSRFAVATKSGSL